MASVFHKVPWDTGSSIPFDKDKWELYNINEDYSQYNDLAASNPKKLKEMRAIFEKEGKKFGIFPLDDRLAQRLDVSLRPSWTSSRTHFAFFPGMTHLDEGTAPNVKNKSHSTGKPGRGSGKPNPLNNVYFGEQHLHTSNSADTFAMGTRNTVDDAYRFCKG